MLHTKDLNESVKAYQRNETLTLLVLAEVLVFGAMLLGKITGQFSIGWGLITAIFWMPFVLIIGFTFLKSLYLSFYLRVLKKN